MTIRALALGAIFTLALLPTTAAALSPIEEVSCPAPVVIDGVTVIPDGAPLDCFYALEQINADPCALDENGGAPLMCQNQIGGDATLSYLIDTVSLVGGGRWNVPYGMLAIEGDHLSASVGCNRMSGLIDRHGHPEPNSDTPMLLHLHDGMMMTMMFCADLAGAESGLVQILNGKNLALSALDGNRAVIESDAGSASLTLIADTSVSAPEYPPFVIQMNDSNYNVASGYVVIDGDRLSASVGCNTLSGSVFVNGDTLTLDGPLISTKMYCEGLADAEAALATVLQGENLTWVSPLELRSDAGAVIFATLCGDCVAPPAESSGPVELVSLLLLFPLLVGALGIAVGLSGDRGRR